jgi:hypothetical protein
MFFQSVFSVVFQAYSAANLDPGSDAFDPWIRQPGSLLIVTWRNETSPPCRRVAVMSRHHCGPP